MHVAFIVAFFCHLVNSEVQINTNSSLFRKCDYFKPTNEVPRALRFFLRRYQQNTTNVDIVVRYRNPASWIHKFDFLDEFLPTFNNLSVRLDIQTFNGGGLDISEPRSYYVLLLDTVFIFQDIIGNLSTTKYDDTGKFYVYFLGSTVDIQNDFTTLDFIFPIALRANVVDLVVLVRRVQDGVENVEVHTCFPFNKYCGDYFGTKLGRYVFEEGKGSFYYFPDIKGNEFFQKKYNKQNHCPLKIAVTNVAPFMIVGKRKSNCYGFFFVSVYCKIPSQLQTGTKSPH